MEFRPDYGPEVYTGLCKIDGFLVGCIGNRQGFMGEKALWGKTIRNMRIILALAESSIARD